MSLKDKVLEYLSNNTDRSVSGQQLAEAHGVSRSAVWKAIESLRDEGHTIEAVTNRGYRLVITDQDTLSTVAIASHSRCLDTTAIHVYDSLDSTNNMAKQLASQGAPHGSLVTADQQTAGRGRLGRTFASPKGSGIYMSLILRPALSLQDATLITTAASVGVCRAVSRISGVDAGIKWVNDIYIGSSKLCGILTEAVTDFEAGGLESVIVGIGVNFQGSREIFPQEVLDRDICWLYGPEGKAGQEAGQVSRNQLIAAIADEVMELCDALPDASFLDYYREHSVVLGRTVTCTGAGETFRARILDIDDRGGLVVMTSEGQQRVLTSGEISLRWTE